MNSLFACCLSYASCLACQGDTPVAYAPGSPENQRGKVLILESERVLEGDVERVGDHFRVRQGTGEVLLPASKALRVCASWDEAYDFMRARANLGDPDERLRLARWCHLHGLRVQALAEVSAAIEMRHEYPEAKQLQALLCRPNSEAAGSPSIAMPPPKKFEQGVDLSAESLATFTTRIHPILMNACAACHSAGRGGAFQLHRSTDAGGHRGALQKTLASVIAHVNMERPAVSPLLVKAVSVHFPKGAAPLAGRQSAAFKTLEQWLNHLPEGNPHLREAFLLRAPAPTFNDSAKKVVAEPRPATEPSARGATRVPTEMPPKSTSPEFVPAALTPPVKVSPAAAPTQTLPSDPFDPIIFNRQMHPKR